VKTLVKKYCLPILLLLVSCARETGVDPVLGELGNYTILFSRYQTELNALGGTVLTTFTIRGDGSNLTDLSGHNLQSNSSGRKGYDNWPRFSPNGRYITYRTTDYGAEQIFRMNPDGSGKVNLTNNSDINVDYEWSPSGEEIVFTRLLQGQYEIFKMKSDGTGQQNLTNNLADDRYPSWSPHGSRIAFSRLVSLSPTRWQVFIMNADGSAPTPLTDASESALFPHWSRDGSKLYYDIPTKGMAVKSVDGTLTRRIDGVYSRWMSWSPDGKSFVTSGLYIVDADFGSHHAMHIPGVEPTWSPDGKWIVFRKTDDTGRGDLWVVRPNGTDLRQLTSSRYGDLNPSWKP
jgi:Tol biopolymer transport system component